MYSRRDSLHLNPVEAVILMWIILDARFAKNMRNLIVELAIFSSDIGSGNCDRSKINEMLLSFVRCH
jgi:hypothetical protein